jgi:2-methylisocitrate lyase-like PEP mutase family enzyme
LPNCGAATARRATVARDRGFGSGSSQSTPLIDAHPVTGRIARSGIGRQTAGSVRGAAPAVTDPRRSAAMRCRRRLSASKPPFPARCTLADTIPEVTTAMGSPSVTDKRRAFQELHAAGCFVIPNPWSIGTAIYLQECGFKALATTSSGFAWSQGRPDGKLSRDQTLAHFESLVAATHVPINADFESGYASDCGELADSVRLAVQTGIAGLSIEDSTGNVDRPLHDLATAVDRIRTARRAIDQAGGDTVLIGRAECFLVGHGNLAETVARLQAYSAAGADCLYAPGLRTRAEIAAVVAAVAPKPVNLLVGSAVEFTLQDMADLGVRRVSVGGALARSAWGAFMRTAQLIAREGRFDGFKDAASGADLDAFFSSAGAR